MNWLFCQVLKGGNPEYVCSLIQLYSNNTGGKNMQKFEFRHIFLPYFTQINILNVE